MKKLKLAQVLGAALALATVAPNAVRAEAIPGSDSTVSQDQFANVVLSPSQFNGMFSQETDVLTSGFQFVDSNVSGTVRSQVFKGKDGTEAAGLYAYAYQVSSNPIPNVASDQRVLNDFDGIAFRFNATPIVTDFVPNTPTRSYLVNGPIGGLVQPSMNGSEQFLSVAGLNYQAIVDDSKNPISGSLTASFTPALAPDNTSATFVVITKEKPDGKTSVNLRSIDATTSITEVYKTAKGEIIPNPVPEPTTIVAWAGMLGAVMVARKFRGRRTAA